MSEPRWSEHVVIPGERISEIARLYNVTPRDIWVWNRLNRNTDKVDVGTRLKVFSPIPPPQRHRVVHEITAGETWASISAQYGIAERYLHRWNRTLPRELEAGQRMEIWAGRPRRAEVVHRPVGRRVYTPVERIGPLIRVEPRRATLPIPGQASAPPMVATNLPKIRQNGQSVGSANRGHLVRGVALPTAPELYTIRKPDESYGSSHSIGLLTGAIARFRRSHAYRGEVVIGAISKKKGGRLRGHKSHQSGRDVDIRLLLANGRKRGSVPESVRDVDWDATWALMYELLRTNQVEYVFLESSRQKHLVRAAKRAGVSSAQLEKWVQYPRKAGTREGIVRHARGHGSHFHVRFFCGPHESRCEGPKYDPRKS